jgi:hypothetical protein
MESKMMAKFTVFLALCIACSMAKMNPMRVEPSGPVEVGSTVTLICPVVELKAGRLVSWWKFFHAEETVPGSPSEEQTEWVAKSVKLAINLGKEIDDPKNRIEPHIDESKDPIIEFKITIKDIQLHDAGWYSCRMTPSDPMLQEFAYISVNAPVKTTEMILTHNGDPKTFTSDQAEVPEVEFALDDSIQIACTASGSNPGPTVSIMSGSEDLYSMVDPGSVSTVQERSYTQTAANGDIEGTVIENKVTKTIDTKVTFDMNSKTISCAGSVDGIDGTMTAAFKIKMEGLPPQFVDCPPTLDSYLHQADVKFSCVYKSEPPVSKATVMWYTGSEDDPMNKKSAEATVGGTPIDGGKYYAHLDTEDDGETRITFIFDRVAMQMFRNYTFVLENDAGQMSHQFELIRDASQERDNSVGGSSFVTASFVTVATMMVLRLFL